jgi:fucose permease
MALGRFAGGRLALRRSVDSLLMAAIATTVVGWAVFWISTAAAPALVGLFVVGLGIATQFPLGITRAIAASGGRPDAATGRASLGAGIAIGTGPFVLGWLADEFGTHRAFLLVPGLLVAAAVALLASRTPAQRRPPPSEPRVVAAT